MFKSLEKNLSFLSVHKISLLILFIALTVPPTPAYSASSKDHSNIAVSPSLAKDQFEEISGWLENLKKSLNKNLGVQEILIGGGSAPAILDTLFLGTSFEARDLDVFVVAGKPVSKEVATTLGEKLQSDGVGTFLVDKLHPTRRANIYSGSAQYYVGYTVNLLQQGRVLDLKIHKSVKDISLQGFFNTEMIKIKITPGQTLKQWLDAALGLNLEDLIKRGMLIDDFGGYLSWRRRSPQLINEFGIQSNPILGAIRTTRLFSKLGHTELPPELSQKIQNFIAASHKPEPQFAVLRDLRKIFADRNASSELAILSKLGVFKYQSANPSRPQISDIKDLDLYFSNLRSRGGINSPIKLSEHIAWKKRDSIPVDALKECDAELISLTPQVIDASTGNFPSSESP